MNLTRQLASFHSWPRMSYSVEYIHKMCLRKPWLMVGIPSYTRRVRPAFRRRPCVVRRYQTATTGAKNEPSAEAVKTIEPYK